MLVGQLEEERGVTKQTLIMSPAAATCKYGDTTYTKIFVGGLAWETQHDTMRIHFEQYGEVLEAVVINDKITGRSKGYGFVTFREADAAVRACVDASPVIDGRCANCNLACLGANRSALSAYCPPQSFAPSHGNSVRFMAPLPASLTPLQGGGGGGGGGSAYIIPAPAFTQHGQYAFQVATSFPYAHSGYALSYSQEYTHQLNTYNAYTTTAVASEHPPLPFLQVYAGTASIYQRYPYMQTHPVSYIPSSQQQQYILSANNNYAISPHHHNLYRPPAAVVATIPQLYIGGYLRTNCPTYALPISLTTTTTGSCSSPLVSIGTAPSH